MTKQNSISETNILYVIESQDFPNDIIQGKVDRRKNKSTGTWTTYILNSNFSYYKDDNHILFSETPNKDFDKLSANILNYCKKYKVQIKSYNMGGSITNTFKKDYEVQVSLNKEFHKTITDFKNAGEIINMDKTKLKSPSITGISQKISCLENYIYLSFTDKKETKHLKIEIRSSFYCNRITNMINKISSNDHGTNFVIDYSNYTSNDYSNLKHTNKQKVDFYNKITQLNATIEDLAKRFNLNLKYFADKAI